MRREIPPATGIDAGGLGFHARWFVFLFPRLSGRIQALEKRPSDGWGRRHQLGIPLSHRLNGTRPGGAVTELHQFAWLGIPLGMTTVNSGGTAQARRRLGL